MRAFYKPHQPGGTSPRRIPSQSGPPMSMMGAPLVLTLPTYCVSLLRAGVILCYQLCKAPNETLDRQRGTSACFVLLSCSIHAIIRVKYKAIQSLYNARLTRELPAAVIARVQADAWSRPAALVQDRGIPHPRQPHRRDVPLATAQIAATRRRARMARPRRCRPAPHPTGFPLLTPRRGARPAQPSPAANRSPRCLRLRSAARHPQGSPPPPISRLTRSCRRPSLCRRSLGAMQPQPRSHRSSSEPRKRSVRRTSRQRCAACCWAPCR